MADEVGRAIAYLRPGHNTFWRWNAADGAIEWQDGTTIAFEPELVPALRELAPRGLPAFPAIVLLFAMCRDDWPNKLREILGEDASALGLELPAGLRRGTDSKTVLAQLALENRSALGPVHSAEVIRGIEQGVPLEALSPSEHEGLSLSGCLMLLQKGISEITRERFAMRMRTGLDDIVAPAPIDLPPAQRARAVLDKLEEDPAHRGLAVLARRLMAAVSVPRHLDDPEELPLGGYSDISNQGPLDRLLISELAQDDEMLSLRVALGEALYMRREIPPRQPTGSRQVLCDAGIRMWGLPRVFGAAVALAIAATTEPGLDVRMFGAQDQRLTDLDLLTREGLLNHLEALEPHAHPGAVARTFIEAIGDAACHDAIIVTHPDVLADPEFQTACELRGHEHLYVATVDRTGEYRLWSLSDRGLKSVAEADLDLSVLLTDARDYAAGSDKELPVILTVEPFPLRLPQIPKASSIYSHPDHGTVNVTNDGRMLRSQVRRKGGAQVTARLPVGKPRMVAALDRDHAVTILDPRRQGELFVVTVHLESGEIVEATIPAAGLSSTAVSRGRLLIMRRHDFELVDPRTGAVLDAIPRPAGGTLHGVTYWTGSKSARLAHDGSALWLDSHPPEPVDIDKLDVALPIPDGHCNLYSRLQAISFGPEQLKFMTRKQRIIVLRFDGSSFYLAHTEGSQRTTLRGFGTPFDIPDGRFRLQVARSQYGSRAYLDSRGILHLLSTDPAVPELSIVLPSQGPVAAWSSRGETFGNSFYLDGEATGSADGMMTILEHFLEEGPQ